MENDKKLKKSITSEVFHVFHHYLESSIPKKEWRAMSVEKVLQITKDIKALAEETMSSDEFAKKWKLPRK